MRALRGRVSGLAQPTYVLDIPGGHGKVPVGPEIEMRMDRRPLSPISVANGILISRSPDGAYVTFNRRCAFIGISSRTRLDPAPGSIFAEANPIPSETLATICPHGSAISECP